MGAATAMLKAKAVTAANRRIFMGITSTGESVGWRADAGNTPNALSRGIIEWHYGICREGF
jgi:hypothetical protein